MQPRLRRTLLVAACLVASISVPTFGVVTGNIHGAQEQPIVDSLAALQALEQQALTLIASATPGEVLPPLTEDSLRILLESAAADAESLAADITAGGPYQDSTRRDIAASILQRIAEYNRDGLKRVDKGIPARYLSTPVQDAFDSARSAMQAMGGVPTTRRDLPALDANPVDGTSFAQDADIASTKNAVKVTKVDVAEGRGDAVGGKGKWKKTRKYKYSNYLSVAALAPKPSPDNYYAFEGTGKTPGYTFKTFGRRLFGPFETRFQVGAFDYLATEDTGSACIEFDVEGSSPLQFVAVCGRRFEGGVQVFVQSYDGPAGSLYLPSTSVATVLVTYSGTQFVVKAATGKGAPDFVLATVGTVNLTQGETALVAGLGASGLTKGAEIGLDEIFITAK